MTATTKLNGYGAYLKQNRIRYTALAKHLNTSKQVIWAKAHQPKKGLNITIKDLLDLAGYNNDTTNNIINAIKEYEEND